MTRAVLLLALAMPAALHAQANWTNPREPFRIAEGLYYVGSEDLASYLLTSEQGHVLIDAPLQENVPRILENIRSLGFDPADIRLQLVSHAHYDHVGGLADMLAATGAELVVSEADADFVRQGRNFGLGGGYPAAAVSRTVANLETVRLGDVELTAHVTPGHTPGCTSWSGTVRIEDEPYDFISPCSLSVLGSYRLDPADPTYEGQAVDYCQSVAHLQSLDPDIFLGAHASWFGIDAKQARLAAGDLRAFVGGDGYRSYLTRALESIERALLEQGVATSCADLAGY